MWSVCICVCVYVCLSTAPLQASKVHEAAAPRSHEDPSTQQDSDDEMHLSPQEFKAIQLEVEKFGEFTISSY